MLNFDPYVCSNSSAQSYDSSNNGTINGNHSSDYPYENLDNNLAQINYNINKNNNFNNNNINSTNNNNNNNNMSVDHRGRKRDFESFDIGDIIDYEISTDEPEKVIELSNQSNHNKDPAGKRHQFKKITTEIHNKTVDLMMNAQRELQRQEKINDDDDIGNIDQKMEYIDSNSDLNNVQSDSQTENDQFVQKPFWPVLVKRVDDNRN
ncbi:unnamed protein product [[Candida] boidinii]|uniref:Unnamed protein product n=1 Tax=Candida boidinii TaxID=5477 RepID=A0A9W6T4V8_CANBO|nr:hypothetical protein B5S30_g4343 [[Candida] boidinii]OWB86792.1 hypothetical protein B5S33_g5506 [[Candida] boidinii]GME75322.1 unnamed protein product [[Candida] boidinii]